MSLTRDAVGESGVRRSARMRSTRRRLCLTILADLQLLVVHAKAGFRALEILPFTSMNTGPDR